MGILSPITSEALKETIRLIDDRAVIIPRNKQGQIYEVRYKGRKYPPKFLVAETYQRVTGQRLRQLYGGKRPNTFLIKRGFRVFDKWSNQPIAAEPDTEDPAESYPEGKQYYAKHRRIERNSKLAQKIKKDRLAKTKDLKCEACGFSFIKRYGPLGEFYIEAHHTIPISTFKKERITNPAEIALVCANCHRMLHFSERLLTVKELRSQLR